jgi:hypothetical protein
MRLLPHQIRLELCLIPDSSSSIHEKQEENKDEVGDGAFALSSTDDVVRRNKILGSAIDARRSTRVIFSHLDDLVARDDLDIYSYEQLTARFHAEFYDQDVQDNDAGDNAGDNAGDAAEPDGLISTSATTTARPTESRCFAQANLHPSRLCRIPNIVDHAVLALLPKNSILVYFSDQSVRVAPQLYQLLRSVHEKYVTVHEERIFTDTAFSSLDQHHPKQKPTMVSSHDFITSSKEEQQRRPVHQSDGSNRTRMIHNNDNEKPTPVAVELDDLRAENELLSRELVRQEEWLQEELSHTDAVQNKTLPALQATLDELQQQNAQLQIELDRRRQRAEYLEFVLHSEQIRLIREVSLLYDINTTTTTTTTPSASSAAERNDGSNNGGDHTTLTIRGQNLSANGVISFINHLVHILLPKYLGVYVRPPPPSPTPQRTAAQRALVWQATLQCLARHIGVPSSSTTSTSLLSTTTNQQPPPPPANVLHSIREIYNHMLQYRQPDSNDDQVGVVDRSGS